MPELTREALIDAVKAAAETVGSEKYVAEVEVEMIEFDDQWAPYVSVEDASKSLFEIIVK